MCEPANTGADWRCSSPTTNSFQGIPDWDQYAQSIYQLGIKHGLCESNQSAAYPQPMTYPTHGYGSVPCHAGPRDVGDLSNSIMAQNYRYLQATQATQATQSSQTAQVHRVPQALQAIQAAQTTQATQAPEITSQPFLGHAQANMPTNRAVQTRFYSQHIIQPTSISAAKRGQVNSLVTMDAHEWNIYGNHFPYARPQLTAQSSDPQCTGGYPVYQPAPNNMHYGSRPWNVPMLEGGFAATYNGRIMDEPAPLKLLVEPVTTRFEPAGAISSLKRAAVSPPNAPRPRPAPNSTKLTNEHRVRKRRKRNDSPCKRFNPDLHFFNAEVSVPENEYAVSDGSPQVETDNKRQYGATAKLN
ncbi:hypothetical protein ACJ73_08702 [Blastomyces percursus]|uniref:Uncharacterized protein n=1 Tax=Blastomyces percursus TaxID=1658174 RepID=A0A1J9QRW4_9EURO|nr:hypothetical protein ACJ73_08702 [Blastomyces percursus]